MKLFILILIIAALLQTTVLPINLCLILLFCRSLIAEEQENYYFAFTIGILLGILSTVNIGFYSLIFVILVKILYVVKKSAISSYLLASLPLAFLTYLLVGFLEQLVFKSSLNLTKIIIETIITLPLYLIIRFWEERFVVKPQLKLKIKN